MSYIVMARKYRPQALGELVGQAHVARTLANAITSGRIAHAYLFTGPRGVGKTTTARILAKAVNCEQGPTADPCGTCTACTDIAEGRSLDVIEIDGASNRGIDEIRDLRERVRYAPPGGRRKVYIIDEVHMLTTEAFNALLKTLEEPPPHVLFVFATTAPQKIPLTISSRCQRFDFRRIPVAVMVERLADIAERESLHVQRGVLERVARKADGSMRDAESLLDQVVAFGGEDVSEADVLRLLGIVEQDRLFALGAGLLGGDLQGLLTDLDELIESGWDLLTVVGGLIGHVRNLLVARIDDARGDPASDAPRDTGLGDLTPEEVARYRESVKDVPEERLLSCLEMLTELEPEMKRASQPRALAEVTLLGFAARPSTEALASLVDRLESLEARLGSGGEGGEAPPRSAGTGGRRTARPKKDAPDRPSPEAGSPPVSRPPQPDLGLESIGALWETLVEQVKGKKMSLGTFLAEGRPDGLDRGVLRLLFDAGKAYHVEQVMEPANRTLVCETLAALLGRPVGIACRAQTTEDAAEPPAEDGPPAGPRDLADSPQAQRLMETFDAEITRFVERPRTRRR